MSAELVNIDVYLAQSQAQSARTDGAGATTEAIDRAVLMALEEVREEGEPDLIVELIDLYLGDAPQWVEAMRSAAATMDVTLLRRAAHTLKGSSGSVGIRQVAEICKALEQLDCSDEAPNVGMLVQSLEREFARACDALKAERQRRVA
jgi:HPt (histidine-containing phosphotransfer) domain-containing protein